MKIDRYVVVGVGLSVLWALIISVLFYGFASRRGSPGRIVRTPVVVATKPLAIGSTISAESVKISQIEQTAVPKGSFSRTEDVVGRAVVSSVLPDEPILEARLANRGSGPGLAPLIPPGMRAVSVRVNDVVGVAGFVLPGMHVDVLVTGRPPGRNDSMTTTVLRNITVLSAGQVIQADPKNQSINAQVVTLLVSPAEAETLTLAHADGHIQLVLRNSSDAAAPATSGRQLSDLYRGGELSAGDQNIRERMTQASSAMRAVAKAPVPQRPSPAGHEATPAKTTPEDSVVIIRGNQKSVESLPRKGD